MTAMNWSRRNIAGSTVERRTWLGKITVDWIEGEFDLEQVKIEGYNGVIYDQYAQLRRAGTSEIVAKYAHDHTGPLTKESRLTQNSIQ